MRLYLALSNDENRNSLSCFYQKDIQKILTRIVLKGVLMQQVHKMTKQILSKFYYYDIS